MNEVNSSVTFTVEKEGNAKGSFITYEVNDDVDVDVDVDLNRSVVISDTNTSNLIYIHWNSPDGHCRVKSETYFKDDLYHCWDHTFNLDYAIGS